VGILTNRRRALRTPQPPAHVGRHAGLSYALFLPAGEPAGGVVILHGAGSCKESHFDFARAARAAGLAAVAFDQRGHGESGGVLGDGLLDDVAAIAGLLPTTASGGGRPLALRGSSMGGYVALLAARKLDARAVVAICPAGADDLLRGLRAGSFEFDADAPALERFLRDHDLVRTVQELRAALLLLHAQGDEQIPADHSAALYRAARMPGKRLIVVPGGHHRSIQHDAELQAESVRFIARAFAEGG
jgi:alpha-beta hydrolase superfamily lysophospholipase